MRSEKRICVLFVFVDPDGLIGCTLILRRNGSDYSQAGAETSHPVSDPPPALSPKSDPARGVPPAEGGLRRLGHRRRRRWRQRYAAGPVGAPSASTWVTS